MAIVALIRLLDLVRMSAGVILQIVLLSESFLTDVTLKWFLTNVVVMTPNVHSEVALVCETFLTVYTPVRFFRHKTLLTILALVIGVVFRMRITMSYKILQSRPFIVL